MRRPLIALVDDDAQALILVRRALQHQAPEFDLVEVRSATELERLLVSHTPDVILLDFNLPQRDGLSILRDLGRGVWRGGVIFITGVGSEKIAVEAMKRGATDYIVKSPGYELRLPRAIQKVLERVDLEREMRERTETVVGDADLASRLEEPLTRSLEEIDSLERELAALADDPASLARGRGHLELCIAKLRNDLERMQQTLSGGPTTGSVD